jgi:hypothetical protein
MVEFEFNRPVDTADLVEFFARCGWEEANAGVKLEWALAASEEWVLCRADGQLIGFGRSCRLGAAKRVMFDVVVDARYRDGILWAQIVHLLSANAGGLEEVSVFSEVDGAWTSAGALFDHEDVDDIPDAPAGTYLGRRHVFMAGDNT